MRTRRRILIAGMLVVAIMLVTFPNAGANAASNAHLPLAHVRDIRLPGHATRFDYQSFDEANRKLYIAHLGDSTLDIVDLDTLHVTGQIPNIADVHGVAVASDLGRVYATATGTNELVAIDTTTNQVLNRTPTGAFPDGIAYDPDDGLVFVSNKNDGSVTVVDANTSHVTGTIKLGDETGNVVYDQGTRLLYAAVRTPDTLVAIDPTSRAVTTRIRLSGCVGAHGVYFDNQTRRAFVACEQNARLVTVDLAHNRQTSTSSVGQDPDVLAFDASLRILYVASESGTVSMFTTSAAASTKVGQGHLGDAAHSVAVDPSSHYVYLPLQDIRGRPVLRIMKPRGP